MKNITKWIPNIFSLSRVIIAPFIVLNATHNKWNLALIFLIIGAATDLFDGALAKKLNAQSKIGAKIIDPLGDLFLTVGAVGGLVLTQSISWLFAISLAIIAAIAYLGTMAIAKPKPLKRFCVGFVPFYNIAIMIAVTATYAAKAFGTQALWLLIPAALLGIYAIKTKQHRLRAWLRGQP